MRLLSVALDHTFCNRSKSMQKLRGWPYFCRETSQEITAQG